MIRRYIVTGDRHWYCDSIAWATLRSIRARHGDDMVVVHGDAPGVDSAFRDAARRFGIEDEPHPADWDRFDKGAGPRRNQTMVDLGAEYAIAVHRDILASKGTKDMVRRCLAAGIPVYLIDGVSPTRRLKFI